MISMPISHTTCNTRLMCSLQLFYIPKSGPPFVLILDM